MSNQRRLLNRPPKSLEEIYFSEIRPLLYDRHAAHYQYGVRSGTTLAEHLDSACQFMLTVSRLAGVPEDKRPKLLAATAVHDLNKLDPKGGNVKTLARDRAFLQEQLELACVSRFVVTEDDFELVRKLIERHSGHNRSDGAIFLPEDPAIDRWAAMITGADLFDLGIPERDRFRKVQTELTVALGRPSKLLRVRVSEDRGYITALLLGACEEVFKKFGLTPLAILPDGEIFEGEALLQVDLTTEIAAVWQTKIDEVFGNNIQQLVRPTKDGIKIAHQAIQQNTDEVLLNVQALLEKKKAGFKAEKVAKDITKWGDAAGDDAVINAANVGLQPVINAEEFAIAEGLKAAYLSYRETGLSPKDVWDKIATHVGLTEQQRTALEPFNGQYGRSLFAAKSVVNGDESILAALRESFQLRGDSQKSQVSEASTEIVTAVARMLNLPNTNHLNGGDYLDSYIETNPRQRCSLGSTFGETDDLISDNMPPGTKVQMFSNRLPGGISAEPKRQADLIAALSYQIMAVGANFPAVKKQDPLYLHLALPKGSCPELLFIWREHLQQLAATNAEGGTVTVDDFKLYRDNLLEFKANKVVGLALPKRPNFIHTTVIIPLIWGDVNASVALLKSLRLALELSLSLEFGFPFTLSSSLEVDSANNMYGQVSGIPASLQLLLGDGQYVKRQEAEEILKRLRCLGKLAISVASIQKADDCLYDLARAAARPIELYYVLLRWILREQDEPNLEHNWSRIREPLNTLLESLMPTENTLLTKYLREASLIAATASLRGSSFKRTSLAEPFTAFTAAVRSQKVHMDLDLLFAALVQQYHTRLDRIREHGVGATKYEQVKEYYQTLRNLYEEVYNSRPEKLLNDKDTLEAAYLFFFQEAQQQLKKKPEDDTDKTATSN